LFHEIENSVSTSKMSKGEVVVWLEFQKSIN
jgi:hypothetical protein